jgi:hypothetical protein
VILYRKWFATKIVVCQAGEKDRWVLEGVLPKSSTGPIMHPTKQSNKQTGERPSFQGPNLESVVGSPGALCQPLNCLVSWFPYDSGN